MHRYLVCLVYVFSTSVSAEVLSTRLLVVVGIVKEAKFAQGKDITLLVSGASPERLAEALDKELIHDIRAVISFGVAGGLDPEIRTGEIINPDEVYFNGQTYTTDAELNERFRSRLVAQGLFVQTGMIAGSTRVVASPEEKAKMFEMIGAAAVDMESHVAAAWAAQHGLPFAALRVISDAAHRSLPQAAIDAVTAEGEIRIRPILTGVLKDLSQVKKLLHAGLDSRKAFNTLAQCQALLGSD
jgi:hopanoid-associated phosphorylase